LNRARVEYVLGNTATANELFSRLVRRSRNAFPGAVDGTTTVAYEWLGATMAASDCDGAKRILTVFGAELGIYADSPRLIVEAACP